MSEASRPEGEAAWDEDYAAVFWRAVGRGREKGEVYLYGARVNLGLVLVGSRD